MRATWNGFACEHFLFEDHEATVVFPEEGTGCGRLLVKTEYRDAFPEVAEIPLLKKGFHMCFIKNDNRWGTDPDLDRKARFIRFVCEKYNLSTRVVPVGLSCGGLIAIKLAAKYPELIACLYLDAPVLNYMSCPCGFGVGEELDNNTGIAEILNALEMDSISQLLCYREMPLDKIPDLIENKIPVVLVAGDSDVTVPYCENGVVLEETYRRTGTEMECYIKPGCDHHPHGLKDPAPVVNFILKHCE